jgi:parallel beta-helix repeat protein
MKKAVSVLMLILLLICMVSLAFNIRPVKASGTIYIRADGSVEGTPYIQTTDNVTYVFTADIINNSIVVQRNDIIIDGNGHTLQGARSGNGIVLSGRKNVTVRNTQINNFSTSIWISHSNDSVISGNNITANKYNGIWFGSSSNSSIIGNNITANGYDGISFDASSNMSIIENNIANNRDGIYLGFSSNCRISGNNITANKYDGIWLYSCSNCSVSRNNIANNTDGILFSYSYYNSIGGNNITANNNYGILLASSYYNRVIGNNIANNNYGVILSYASGNNRFYHNNFIDNIQQVQIVGPSPPLNNAWDSGYPSGGNYWSDYIGIDEKSGPFQNLIGSDGISDTPYVIDESNIDHYPLMNPTSAPIISGVVQILEPENGFVTIGSVNINFSVVNIDGPVEFKKGDAHNRIDLEIEFTDKAFGVQVWSTSSDGLTLDWGQTFTETVTYESTSQEVYGDVIVRIVHWKYNPATGSYEYGEFGVDEIRGTLLSPLSVSISPLSASMNIGQSATFTSTASGGYSPYSYQWYLNDAPVSSATSNTWTFMPTTSRIDYVYLKVTDAKGNTTQSETARITVTAVPVGGYSFPIGQSIKAESLAPYVTIVAISAILFTAIKRKAVRKAKTSSK